MDTISCSSFLGGGQEILMFVCTNFVLHMCYTKVTSNYKKDIALVILFSKYMYHERTNFRGHNISWVKFLWGLIFVGNTGPP